MMCLGVYGISQALFYLCAAFTDPQDDAERMH